MPIWFHILTQVSVLAFALLGGVFLAFSDFIMRALGIAGGPAAMQAINREVFRYVFIPLFFIMVPVSLVLGAGALTMAANPWPFVAAAAIYIAGVFGVTGFFNVPMNNALAALDAASADGQRYWTATYLPNWTFWNSVRAGACLAAAALLLFGGAAA